MANGRPLGSPIPPGRTKEAGDIELVIRGVERGEKRGFHLTGGAGVGKTTLLHWAHEQAVHAGFVCAFVRTPPTGGLPPRFPLPELFSALGRAHEAAGRAVPKELDQTARAFSGSATRGRSSPPDLLHMVSALEAAAGQARIGIFIDDVQWAPSESMHTLVAALRVVEASVLFASAARIAEPDLETTVGPESASDLPIQTLDLTGLDLDAVSEVTAEVLGGPVLPSLVRELHRSTLGNPLFVHETLRHWVASGRVTRVAGGYWALGAEAADDVSSLTGTIKHRLRKLNPEALEVARTLAVLGRRVDFDEIRVLTSRSDSELIDQLASLESAGIVATEHGSGPTYGVAHPLFGSALVSDMGPTREGALHARIYHALVARRHVGVPVASAEIAHHADRALELPSGSRDFIAAAADEAERLGSYADAAGWFGVLATTAPDTAGRIGALRGKAAATQHFDPEAAIGLYSEALACSPPDLERAQLLIGRARARRMAGVALDDALDDLLLASALGGREVELEATHLTGIVHGVRGEIDQAESAFVRLLDLGPESPLRARVVGSLGHVAFVRGNVAEAVRLSQQALEEPAIDDYREHLNMSLTWFLKMSGRWDEAERLLDVSLDRARRAHDVWLLVPMLSTAAILMAFKGDLTRAFDFGNEALRFSASRLHTTFDRIHAINALATALLQAGRPIDALDVQSELVTLTAESAEKWDITYPLLVLAETYLQVGDVERAKSVAEEARAYLHLNRAYEPNMDRLDAAIALACEDLPRAAAIVQRRAEEPNENPFELARVLELGAEIALKSRDHEKAVASAAAALELYRDLGARVRAHHVQEWIERHRTKPVGRPRSERPAGLTDREVDIIRRIVDGETNRMIAEALTVSPATVKKHVENILAKTGASRRAELGRRAAELGILLD